MTGENAYIRSMRLTQLLSILQPKYSGVIGSIALLVLVAYHLRSHEPASPVSDYIEKKTTVGGRPNMSLSMYNNDFLLSANSVSSVYPATSDLNLEAKRPQRENREVKFSTE